MTISVPSKKSVARAGEILRASETVSLNDYEEAFRTLSQWRGLFAYPLNTFYSLLTKKCNSLGLHDAIVARRMKRTPSIIKKLTRFKNMRLDRMQDIGGLRVIVSSAEDVYRLHNSLCHSRIYHDVIYPCDDYIKSPKPDGYRSLHQVFKYKSKTYPELCGLRVEVQIRTQIQHSWATAVEALGVIEKAAFKSGEGGKEFKRFFVLSSALLSIKEGQPIVEELANIDKLEIVKELEDLEQRLGIFLKLQGVAITVKRLGSQGKGVAYYLMELNVLENSLRLWGFGPSDLQEAEDYYKFRETEAREKENIDVVLISASSLKLVKKAYPNYFLDCGEFIKNLREICKKIKTEHH